MTQCTFLHNWPWRGTRCRNTAKFDLDLDGNLQHCHQHSDAVKAKRAATRAATAKRHADKDEAQVRLYKAQAAATAAIGAIAAGHADPVGLAVVTWGEITAATDALVAIARTK
jgi:hypothetical protein